MIRQCGRCGIEDREPHVRSTIANRERESVQDGTPFSLPRFAIEYRCADKEACGARVASRQGGER